MIEPIPRFSAGPEIHASEHTALWIPGIQDAVGDREQLCDLLDKEGIHVDHPDVHYQEFKTFNKKADWMHHKTEQEVALINEQSHTILIATSFGTHRTIEILQQCPRVQTVVLLNPPKNEMSKNNGNDNEAKSTEDTSTPAESMLRPLALEMSDATFGSFLERHEQAYEHERHRMKTELRGLREGPTFANLLRKCRQDVQILLVKAPLDPWNIEEELHHPNMRTETMETAFHYPHVSQPERLAKIISTWIKGSLQSNRSAVASSVVPTELSVT
ncbi:MAG: hypothetical protein O3A80_00190 [bacterium]|nr:hypothetical protein [bacterium]MDA1292646.1 hypothetical protein [bacterium]